jgi:hypothetical protein
MVTSRERRRSIGLSPARGYEGNWPGKIHPGMGEANSMTMLDSGTVRLCESQLSVVGARASGGTGWGGERLVVRGRWVLPTDSRAYSHMGTRFA